MSEIFSIPTDTWTRRVNKRMRVPDAQTTHPNQIRSHPRRELLFLGELLVRRRRRVDDECLRIAWIADREPTSVTVPSETVPTARELTNVREVTRELHFVDNLAADAGVAFDPECQHPAERARAEEAQRVLVRLV